MIYLATPYAHPSPAIEEGRFVTACRIAGKLIRAGHVVFSPIAHTHPISAHTELPRGWEFWQKQDRTMMQIADTLLVVMMDGWRESKGIAAEIDLARELGITTRYADPDEPLRWLDSW